MAKVSLVRSRAEAMAAAERVRELVIERDGLVAKQEALLLKVKAKCGPGIDAAETEIAELCERVHAWAVENRRAEFGEAQSLELPAAWLRFRLGQRKLLLRSKWSWDDVLEAMVKAKGVWRRYIRRDPDVDKARILADARNALLADLDDDKVTDKEAREDCLDPALLAGVGLKIVQEEGFSVESKVETK